MINIEQADNTMNACTTQHNDACSTIKYNEARAQHTHDTYYGQLVMDIQI